MLTEGPTPRIRVLGDPDNDWRIERSSDLLTWSVDRSLTTLLAGNETNAPAKAVVDLTLSGAGFFRAVRTEGLYDPTLLRTFRLSFSQSNWTNLLTSALKDGTDVPCSLTVENIFTDDEDSTVTPGLHASFKLDKEGESLALVDTDANLNLLLDSTTFGPLGAEKAWARAAASPTLFQIQVPSPGAANP